MSGPPHAKHLTVELAPTDTSPLPLPANVESRMALPRERERWGRSFFDVPRTPRASPTHTTIEDARVLTATDQWDLQHFAVLSSTESRYSASGLRWLEGHRALLVEGESECLYDRVFWPWESWRDNYFHWVFGHLTKLIWMVENGQASNLVAPHRFAANRFQLTSAGLLGIDLAETRQMDTLVLRASELQLMGFPELHPYSVSQLRKAYAGLRDPPAGRRLYVTRARKPEGVADRGLSNESEVIELLLEHGFEVIEFAKLQFDAQVRACSQAYLVVAQHGAGLANITFCHPGAQLVEIVDPRFPNPIYYELAAMSGLAYWKVDGVPTDHTYERGYGTLRVRVNELREIVRRASRLATP